MAVTSYAVALGSNRRGRHGGPADEVRAAVAAMQALGRIVAASPIMASAPVGPSIRRFANCTAVIETALAPPALLAALKRIERTAGRRRGRRWGARVLDLDIVLWSGGVWPTRSLAIPHPAFRTRGFVLAPLRAIAPGWRDPVTGRTVQQLHARLTAPRPLRRSRSPGAGP